MTSCQVFFSYTFLVHSSYRQFTADKLLMRVDNIVIFTLIVPYIDFFARNIKLNKIEHTRGDKWIFNKNLKS